MKRLSAVIITYNEEKNIGQCIDSLWLVADEIIVMDSFSKDETVNIARQKGAMVYQQSFAGYKQQKNAALSLATFDHVISLDADESLSEELVRSIRKEKENFSFDAYSMNRCSIYCGRPIRRGLWYPDRKLRLFKKQEARWGGYNPHDRVEMNHSVHVSHLDGDIIHYSYETVEEHREKNEKFSFILAASLMDADCRPAPLKIIFSPLWAFFNGYILRLGLLDGRRGWNIAIHTASHSFLKHTRHRQLFRQQKQSQKLVLESKYS